MSERNERREFELDVFYEAWRRGYDPDRAISCAEDCYDAGRTAEQCVDGYASRIRSQREARELEEMQYYAEQGEAE